ncbi:MAG: hypothetical protein AB4372_09740 [Xenococcus sp. (in: cyanobacteria)]
MEPLKITIEGEYWDCRIYRGRLYLWERHGSLSVLNWDKIAEHFSDVISDDLVFKWSFQNSSNLYRLFELCSRDPEIQNLIYNRFINITKHSFSIYSKQVEQFIYGQQDNPFFELPTDTDIYKNKVFAVNSLGLFQATTLRKSNKYPVSTRPKKLLDIPLLSVRAKSNMLAISGGDLGLFECHLGSRPQKNEFLQVNEKVYQVSQEHSEVANWSFAGIYSSSKVGHSYLAAFDWGRFYSESESGKRRSKLRREFRKIIEQSEIFPDLSGFSWGTGEKIYQVVPTGIMVVKYTQKGIGVKSHEENFSTLGEINFSDWKGAVINGGVALFGVVVECEDSLIILRSDGEIYKIPNPVVRWRVYPRSLWYENHLHVIHDDRVDIYLFNHDYFIDQSSKLAGITQAKQGPRTEWHAR